MNIFYYNLPTVLTLLRLIASPFLMPILIVLVLPLNVFKYNVFVSLFFAILSLTDFLDGYLARRYKLETKLGSVLDPIADKFLLFSTLIGLVYINKIFYFWAIIFIGREFFIMCLREVALTNCFVIKVSYLGKLKTTFQLLYLTFLIINSNKNLQFCNLIENILLILALYFTIYSALEYFKTFIKEYKQVD